MLLRKESLRRMPARFREREGGGEVGGDIVDLGDMSSDNVGLNDTGDKSGAQSARDVAGRSFDWTAGRCIGTVDDVVGRARFISLSGVSGVVVGVMTDKPGLATSVSEGLDDLNNFSGMV
jgi:hypothetical protein